MPLYFQHVFTLTTYWSAGNIIFKKRSTLKSLMGKIQLENYYSHDSCMS